MFGRSRQTFRHDVKNEATPKRFNIFSKLTYSISKLTIKIAAFENETFAVIDPPRPSLLEITIRSYRQINNKMLIDSTKNRG